jgi:hypothetical protein
MPRRARKTRRARRSGRAREARRAAGSARSSGRGRVGVRVRAIGPRRAARSLRPWRPPPVADRFLAGRLGRTGLIPAAAPSARGARRRRAIRAIGARRHPAPVRQPVLAAGRRPAVLRTPVHRGARCAVRPDALSIPGARVGRGRREASRWRAKARAAWLLGRHLPGPSQQLAVLIVVSIVRPVRAWAVPIPGVRPVGAAIAQASSPRLAVGIAAQAGVATFHQVPPGLYCPAAPRDMLYLTSVGRDKSPVEPRRPIVINCTYSSGIDGVTPGIEVRRVTHSGRDTNRSRQGILSSRFHSAERPWNPGSSG